MLGGLQSTSDNVVSPRDMPDDDRQFLLLYPESQSLLLLHPIFDVRVSMHNHLSVENRRVNICFHKCWVSVLLSNVQEEWRLELLEDVVFPFLRKLKHIWDQQRVHEVCGRYHVIQPVVYKRLAIELPKKDYRGLANIKDSVQIGAIWIFYCVILKDWLLKS